MALAFDGKGGVLTEITFARAPGPSFIPQEIVHVVNTKTAVLVRQNEVIAFVLQDSGLWHRQNLNLGIPPDLRILVTVVFNTQTKTHDVCVVEGCRRLKICSVLDWSVSTHELPAFSDGDREAVMHSLFGFYDCYFATTLAPLGTTRELRIFKVPTMMGENPPHSRFIFEYPIEHIAVSQNGHVFGVINGGDVIVFENNGSRMLMRINLHAEISKHVCINTCVDPDTQKTRRTLALFTSKNEVFVYDLDARHRITMVGVSQHRQLYSIALTRDAKFCMLVGKRELFRITLIPGQVKHAEAAHVCLPFEHTLVHMDLVSSHPRMSAMILCPPIESPSMPVHLKHLANKVFVCTHFLDSVSYKTRASISSPVMSVFNLLAVINWRIANGRSTLIRASAHLPSEIMEIIFQFFIGRVHWQTAPLLKY